LINHPFEFVQFNYQQRLFYFFSGISILCYIVFAILNSPLQNTLSPSGIVSLELAGSAEKADAILKSWDDGARLNAAFGLGFDFLFMPAYSMSLSIGVLLAIKKRKGLWLSLGRFLGWGAVAAPGFDVFENIALLLYLVGNKSDFLPVAALICALIKFGLIICGAIFGFFGWIIPAKRI